MCVTLYLVLPLDTRGGDIVMDISSKNGYNGY